MFDKADTDKDDSLNFEEFQKYIDQQNVQLEEINPPADIEELIFDAADGLEIKEGLSIKEWSDYAKSKFPMLSDHKLV